MLSQGGAFGFNPEIVLALIYLVTLYVKTPIWRASRDAPGRATFCAAKRKYRRGVSRSTEQRILHPRIRDLSADQPPRARDGIGNLNYNDTT